MATTYVYMCIKKGAIFPSPFVVYSTYWQFAWYRRSSRVYICGVGLFLSWLGYLSITFSFPVLFVWFVFICSTGSHSWSFFLFCLFLSRIFLTFSSLNWKLFYSFFRFQFVYALFFLQSVYCIFGLTKCI